MRRGAALGTLWLLTAIGIYISVAAFQQSHPQRWLALPFTLLFLLTGLAFTFIFRKSDPQRITINKPEGLIEFERVFLLSGFLPRTATFSCRLSDVRRIELVDNDSPAPSWLHIYTPRGRVLIHSASENFHRFSDYLPETVPKGHVPMTSRPWFPAALAATLVAIGLIVAFWRGWLP